MIPMAAVQAGVALKIGHLLAGADLSAKQFTFVKLNASGQVVAVSAVGDKPIGVLQNKPQSGQACEIVCIGVTEVVAGSAAIVANDLVYLMADGKVDETNTSTLVGRALEAATNGTLFTAYVNITPA